MKEYIFIFLLLISANKFKAQSIYLGTKSYSSTEIWRFKNAPDPKWGNIKHDVYSEISIARDGNLGMLIISTVVLDQVEKISESLSVPVPEIFHELNMKKNG